MRTLLNKDGGNKEFNISEYLTVEQVKALFSKLTCKRKKGINIHMPAEAAQIEITTKEPDTTYESDNLDKISVNETIYKDDQELFYIPYQLKFRKRLMLNNIKPIWDQLKNQRKIVRQFLKWESSQQLIMKAQVISKVPEPMPSGRFVELPLVDFNHIENMFT